MSSLDLPLRLLPLTLWCSWNEALTDDRRKVSCHLFLILALIHWKLRELPTLTKVSSLFDPFQIPFKLEFVYDASGPWLMHLLVYFNGAIFNNFGIGFSTVPWKPLFLFFNFKSATQITGSSIALSTKAFYEGMWWLFFTMTTEG